MTKAIAEMKSGIEQMMKLDWLCKWPDMYGLIAQSVGASEQGSVAVGSNPTQTKVTLKNPSLVNIYIYIFIYI